MIKFLWNFIFSIVFVYENKYININNIFLLHISICNVIYHIFKWELAAWVAPWVRAFARQVDGLFQLIKRTKMFNFYRLFIGWKSYLRLNYMPYKYLIGKHISSLKQLQHKKPLNYISKRLFHVYKDHLIRSLLLHVWFSSSELTEKGTKHNLPLGSFQRWSFSLHNNQFY